MVYVNGNSSDKVVFGSGNKNFKSSSSNRRILFIFSIPVEVSSDLRYVSPSTSSDSNIDAGLISSDIISFPGKGGTTTDLSVILEGPIVSRSSISSTRNRYLLNTYPTVAVKYNNVYLKYIKSQEMSAPSGVASYTGKASYDVVWDYQPQD